MMGGAPPGQLPAVGTIRGTVILGLGTMIGVTVWPVGTTTLIDCTDIPGVSITGGVTVTGVPDIVVV